ncbi:hypothetical protein QJS04_geneDACA010075 [Acorus gramineus]|uniref:DUF7054 domain-containing protein n=1 Tax=Acorus gramineus TaxID=55184 RepID=A0AAV9BL53_ACOGR|nr:hypothetical protein QJS04_geneDACA010075 [Acorus gramineus]
MLLSAAERGNREPPLPPPPLIPKPTSMPANRLGGRAPDRLRRPRTPPTGETKVPAKVPVNVTVKGSLAPLPLMASTEWTVGDLVEAAVRQYVKEGRRPAILPPSAAATADEFGLHYSQFSLESLDPKERLMWMGSRSFFLCPKQRKQNSKEEELKKIVPFSWLQFMDFLL